LDIRENGLKAGGQRNSLMMVNSDRAPTVQGPTAAAIANAVHDALGVRVCDLPLTPQHIVEAIARG